LDIDAIVDFQSGAGFGYRSVQRDLACDDQPLNLRPAITVGCFACGETASKKNIQPLSYGTAIDRQLADCHDCMQQISWLD
jgi:hypothetical protein